MEKRYQVFVSSTYADLKAERQKVIQALMEMDCIPAGMELFPAADEEQWEFIKTVIDDCDYYLLIIGGRYGSITAEGISYTEKEFDYAFNKGLKIVALVHDDPDSLPVNKSDINPDLRNKLSEFRAKVASGRLVKFWKEANELPGMVVLSLTKTIKMYPAVGWVRGSTVASNDVLVEINELRKQNLKLQETVKANQIENRADLSSLADLDSNFEFHGSSLVSSAGSRGYRKGWVLKITWRKIFGLLAPYLMEKPPEEVVRSAFIKAITDYGEVGGRSKILDDQEFKTVGIQLKALGLVDIEYLKTTSGGRALFWSLTSAGERLMVEERTIKRSNKSE